jgi:probable F420-dependent oxidoreductase
MDIGISLPTVGPAGRRKYVLQVAEAADRLGFHSVWISSHVALPAERHSTCLYPRATTSDAYNWGVAWLDPIAVMGVVAGATENIRIGTHVLALPYRNPVILAGELAALDQLSEGRIELGAGIGWMDEEFAAVGVPRTQRGARTDESIELMRTLWAANEPTSYHGRFHQVEDMWLTSRPYRAGGPRIHVGGNSDPALRRVGRMGDGWLGHEVYPDEVAASRQLIERHAREAGRDPSSIMISARRGLVPPFPVMNFMSDRNNLSGSPEQIAEALAQYQDVGVSLMVLDLNLRPQEIVDTLEWLSKDVVPLLS